MSTQHFSISDFYCLVCGQKGVPIARRKDSQREEGHLKKIYCCKCKDETNHLERRPFNAETDEEFQELLKQEMGRLKLMTETDKPTLFVMIAPPASGKSTLAQEAGEKTGATIVSRDEVRQSLLEDGDGFWDKETLVFATFVSKIQKEIKAGRSVIADATHISKISRTKLLSRLDTEDCEVVAVVVETPFDIAMTRNSKRQGSALVPDEVMESMFKNFDTSTLAEEGFDKVITVKGTKKV